MTEGFNIAEEPRCPAVISAPGYGRAQCANPIDHPPGHGGVRWYEILVSTPNWTIHEAPVAACDDYPTCMDTCTWPICADQTEVADD